MISWGIQSTVNAADYFCKPIKRCFKRILKDHFGPICDNHWIPCQKCLRQPATFLARRRTERRGFKKGCALRRWGLSCVGVFGCVSEQLHIQSEAQASAQQDLSESMQHIDFSWLRCHHTSRRHGLQAGSYVSERDCKTAPGGTCVTRLDASKKRLSLSIPLKCQCHQ